MQTTRRSNVAAAIRTTALLGGLTGLLVVIGALIGGPNTALLFLGIAAVMNLGVYWFSDKIALKTAGAKPLSEEDAPKIYEMVRELTTSAKMPMPALYLIPQSQPNAFATGRSPDKAAVAVTAGITQLLSPDELRGVIAHELAHIRNRDTLIQAVAATIGGAITYLGYMLLWFGGDDESPLSLIASLAFGSACADRGVDNPVGDLPPARVLGRRDRCPDLRQPGESRLGAAQAGGGEQGGADEGQRGHGVPLHRQADPWQEGAGEPVQHPSADRGSRSPPASDAPRAGLICGPFARLSRRWGPRYTF